MEEQYRSFRKENHIEEFNRDSIELIQLLQTSLDIENIVNIFLNKLETIITINGAEYINPIVNIKLERGSKGVHSIDYKISHESQNFGNLTLSKDVPFTKEEIYITENLLSTLVLPLKNGLAYWYAMQNALRDSLTAIGNRRALFAALKHQIQMNSRHPVKTTILFIDLDNFKQINDTLGHHYGDKILQLTANTLVSLIRDCDMCFRYGGDEFVVILDNSSIEGAEKLANRIKDEFTTLFSKCKTKLPEKAKPISVSIGLTNILSHDTVNTIIHRADKALYAAKKSGKNSIEKK